MAAPHYVASANEFPIDVKVQHGLTKIQFAPDHNVRTLAIANWDGSVKLSNVDMPNKPVDMRTLYHAKPVLAFTFMGSPQYIVSGDTDGNVKTYNVETGIDTSIGRHEGAVRCLEYSPTMRWAVSGGWDKLIKLWDIRSNMPVHATEMDSKVYALSTVDYKAVIGTSDRKIGILDLRNPRTMWQTRESPLKYQTRAISCMPNKQGFVLSSIEGRVAVEYFDMDPETQKNKYAFKCHRQKVDTCEFIYPVNAIAFHPQYNSFATGGSDGLVNVWDPANRKRLCQLRKFNTSVVSLDFSPDGEYVALATTYMYEGETTPNPIPDPEVLIRKITDFEVKPK
uniref:EIF2A domain-containing protein n=1 Tax=Panagrellus redivivus TaxID=6233 RepID=A0A7E4V189_PANRE